MSRPRKPWLDWRLERDLIASVLENKGGVLRVQATASGPLVEFASALRSHLEHDPWERPWRTILFDPENSNTRYFGGMLRQIERSLAIASTPASPMVLGDGSKFGADLSASTITIENSFNVGTGDYERAVADENRAKAILDAIRKHVQRESLCLMFLHSERFVRADLIAVLDLLWSQGLEALTNDGLLIVDLSRTGVRTDVDWPPSPNACIHLHDAYDAQTRLAAIEDLSRFLVEFGIESSELEAKAYSRAMLDSHNLPTTLYAQLANVIASRGLKR